jgi:hypothetical protein
VTELMATRRVLRELGMVAAGLAPTAPRDHFMTEDEMRAQFRAYANRKAS